MPELPEVETIREIVEPEIKGKKIASIEVFRGASILTGEKEFVTALTGKTFLSLSREGKFLLFHLTHDLVIISHLRMEGKYFITPKNYVKEKHDILIYHFSDGTGLRFNDVRKFGILMLSNEERCHKEPPLSTLGKEPFALTPDELYDGLQKKKTEPIKEALLDQTLIAGLGNIYDDEVLFAASINPKRLASFITKEECSSIITESRRILHNAIINHGSTIKSYHPKEGMSGGMQNLLLAYGRGNKPCTRCGMPLRKISIGGRGTVYCPNCQRIENKPFIVSITGPIASGKSTVLKYLISKGYLGISCDEEIKKLYEEDDIKNGLKAIFGEEVIKEEKADKALISKEIAGDLAKKKALTDLLYPLLYARIDKIIDETEKKKIAIEVPLLLGSPLEDISDLVIYVDTSKEKEKERLLSRNVDPDIALSINSSFKRGLSKKMAGLVVSGNGDVSELTKELERAKYL